RAFREAQGSIGSSKPTAIQEIVRVNFGQSMRRRKRIVNIRPAAARTSGVSGRTRVPRPTKMPPIAAHPANEKVLRGDAELGLAMKGCSSSQTKISRAKVVKSMASSSVTKIEA